MALAFAETPTLDDLEALFAPYELEETTLHEQPRLFEVAAAPVPDARVELTTAVGHITLLKQALHEELDKLRADSESPAKYRQAAFEALDAHRKLMPYHTETIRQISLEYAGVEVGVVDENGLNVLHIPYCNYDVDSKRLVGQAATAGIVSFSPDRIFGRATNA